jgi:hypothetical protein
VGCECGVDVLRSRNGGRNADRHDDERGGRDPDEQGPSRGKHRVDAEWLCEQLVVVGAEGANRRHRGFFRSRAHLMRGPAPGQTCALFAKITLSR